MQEFPQLDQLQFFLKGDPSLTQIVINPYGLNLIFDNSCSVIVEEAITYATEFTKIRYGKEWRNEAPILFNSLLEQKLVLLDRSDFELKFVFSGGGFLIVHSERGPYESGQLYDEHGLAFVF